MLAVTIHLAQEAINLYNAYHPLRRQHEIELGEISVTAEDQPIYLGGDFNAHHLDLNDPNSTQHNTTNPTGRHIVDIYEADI